uniref:Putative reverse transcriptase domain, reverse transcriptase zinc-binding domain protein n=1 Tax=Tanacetum cinerariifolium TaxID=118510 RepID=A0A6L2M9W3_TANCI|nr:putative reverse transcriptase domain, reverse transcriptase zinc-binding domain protein [Tanacetum cinerariifolium]
MEKCSSISGLNPNIWKSTIFFGNVQDHVKQAILSILPFKVGSLPVSYLGVSLITKQLSFTDCKCLIDRVETKFNNWMNIMLSYAGRLQLITSILSSMQVYWASVFILPKIVFKDIDKILKGFLWCQGELLKEKVKISWKQVCKTKEEGGLGIKDLSLWIEVLMSKHLWNVVSMKESIWVKWVSNNKLRGSSIWEIECDNDASSGWKSILGLRDKMRHHIICKVGDGSSIFLWHDKCRDGLQHYRVIVVLKSISVLKLSDGVRDTFLWKTKDGKIVNYSTNKAWKDWRNTSDKVNRYDFVWFTKCTPKHFFIMWMAVQNRLTTQERLLKWYPDKQVECLCCGRYPDSLNHLFFECSFTKELWCKIRTTAEINSMPDKLEDIVNLMSMKKHNKSIKSMLVRLILAACVYFIWTERNKRRFTTKKQSCKDMIENVVYHIRLKLASLTVKRTEQVEEDIAMMGLNILELPSVRTPADYNTCIRWPWVGLVFLLWVSLDSLHREVRMYFYEGECFTPSDAYSFLLRCSYSEAATAIWIVLIDV